MEDARAMARSSKAGRVSRMLGANNSSASVMASEGSDGTQVSGGVSGVSNFTAPSGRSAKGRMDKPARARGGRVKGRTNVTVIVQPQGGGGGADPLSAAMGAKMGAMAGGGPQGAGAPPMGAMPPGAMPPGAGGPPGAPSMGGTPPQPPMGGQPVPMRKRGGPVKVKMVDGAGGGLGRIADGKAQKAFMRAKGGPCWSGYEAVGTKKQGKRSVPDCRPS